MFFPKLAEKNLKPFSTKMNHCNILITTSPEIAGQNWIKKFENSRIKFENIAPFSVWTNSSTLVYIMYDADLQMCTLLFFPMVFPKIADRIWKNRTVIYFAFKAHLMRKKRKLIYFAFFGHTVSPCISILKSSWDCKIKIHNFVLF